MGITSLLKFLHDRFVNCKLSHFKGKTIGVDAYVWLHKSVYCNNMELAINPNSKAYVSFFFSLVKKFLKHNIKLVVVFDGGKLPLKAKEEGARMFSRDQKRNAALAHLKNGDLDKYKSLYTSSIDITPEMTIPIINNLKELGIEYIIAPYESDAELAYLASINYIDVVCTEDSDLIAYGCPNVIYKFDYKTESVQLISIESVLAKFRDYDQLLEFCVLTGCDYFKAEGISINKAHAIIKKYTTFKTCIFKDKDKYVNSFYRAKNMFLHQVIYCPNDKICKNLKPFEAPQEEPEIYGSLLDQGLIRKIQELEINPVSLKPFS